MRIDRPDEGDAPDRTPERRAGVDAVAVLGPEAQAAEARAAEHARYRAVVEQVYSRDTLGQDLASMRSAWERHVELYPQRTRPAPRTQPDGSWVAGPDRRLTPDQNAEAAKACAEIRDEAERVILPAMRRVEAADPERRLAGLENMLKGEDRLKEKIADEMLAKPETTAEQAPITVADAVRFTLTYNSERYADGVLSDVERLKVEGFELLKLKNLWTDDQYKGINSQWRRPETGLRFEVQFHTADSLEAKELTHKAYERLRGSSASPIERRDLENFQRRVSALIVTPPGATEIEDFPKKKQNE